MSSSDYIPRKILKFNTWQQNFVSVVEPNATAWGIPADEVIFLKASQEPWTKAYNAAKIKQTSSTADKLNRNTERKSYEKILRQFNRQWLSGNSKVTDGQRLLLGTTVNLNTRTPVAVPDSTPYGRVDFSTGSQHSIHITDSESGRKAKPKGVHECQIWTKFGGDAPHDDEDFVFLETCTKSPCLIAYTLGDMGKMVYYRMRWVNRRGKVGPWGNTFFALVMA
jgi:hypothetical protein